MLNYVSFSVGDLERSAAFYDALLGPLGWRRHMEEDRTVGWGLVRAVFFIVADGSAPEPGFGQISFPAKSIPAVKAAFESAVERGGEPEDEPGAAPDLGGGKYSARVRDPDGYRVEIASVPE